MDITQFLTPEAKGAIGALIALAIGNIGKGMTSGRQSYLLGLIITLCGFIGDIGKGAQELLQKVQDR